MSRRETPRRGPGAGVIAVAATYVYFLLFAQFSFLALLDARLAGAASARPAMVAMGAGGLLASLLTAALLRRLRARDLVQAGFAACAASALAATLCRTPAGFVATAAAIGVSVAVLTVALAADLRRFLGGPRFGQWLGVGTGAAYLFCNLPGVFDAAPERQALLVAVVATLGLLAARAAGERASPGGDVAARALGPRDYRGFGFASIVLSLLALVWIDSAAFVIIQETGELRGLTWSGHAGALLIGITHLGAAVVAGRLIDRGWFRALLLAAFGLFVVAFAALGGGGFPAGLAGPLYALGISAYSVALVAYPALHGDAAGLVPSRWRAGVVFGACGWIGSAAGVGMAQDLHAIPPAFLAIAGAVLLAAAIPAGGGARGALGRQLSIALGFGAVSLLVHAPSPGAAPDAIGAPAAGEIARGRAVYVAEGCIHCHSQYVRPGTRDEAWWGPRAPASAATDRTLIGARRQGPDLARVGNRRSPQWNRVHLIDPRAVSPASRMPGYAHLFEHGDRRGEDLVAYLASLGAGTEARRYANTQQAELGAAAAPGRPARGAAVFARWCASCHGDGGRGDGAAATSLRRPAMNLRKDEFSLVSWGPGAEPEQAAVARVVKFGVPGTAMPGHEYLTDRELADVAAFVRGLRGTDAGNVAE